MGFPSSKRLNSDQRQRSGERRQQRTRSDQQDPVLDKPARRHGAKRAGDALPAICRLSRGAPGAWPSRHRLRRIRERANGEHLQGGPTGLQDLTHERHQDLLC